MKRINFNLGSSDDEKKRSSYKELSSNNICKANGEKNETVYVCGYCIFSTHRQKLNPVTYSNCQINCNYNEARCNCGPKIPNSEIDQMKKATAGNEGDFSVEKPRNFEGPKRVIKEGSKISNHESRNIRRTPTPKRSNFGNNQIRKAIIENEKDFNAEKPRNWPKIVPQIYRKPKRPNFENNQIRKAIIENEKDFNAEKPHNSNREIKEVPKMPNYGSRNIWGPKPANSENDQIRKSIEQNEDDLEAEKPRNFEGFNRETRKRAWDHKIGSYLSHPDEPEYPDEEEEEFYGQK